MIRAIPTWVNNNYPHGEMSILRGASGSDHYIKMGKKTAVWYYFAKEWVFAELQGSNPEEAEFMRNNLAKPDSVLDRGRQSKVRFHMVTEPDFEAMQKILEKRVKS